MNHKSLRRQKVLENRQEKQERRKQRQKENRKNVVSEQHRINYYLAKQFKNPIDDRDLGLVKYYKQRYAIDLKRAKKKHTQAQHCIHCPHNCEGWCNKKHAWCNEAVKNCLK